MLSPFLIKRGATQPILRFQINTNIAGNLAGATVLMRLKRQDDGLITEHVVNVDDATTGDAHYQFVAGETDSAGVLWGELWITFGDGSVMKIPNDPSDTSWFNVNIEQDNS